MWAVVASIVERNGGFEHRMSSMSDEDSKKLDNIAADAKTSVQYLVRCVRRKRGVKVANRPNANGDLPNRVNYCVRCGMHVAKLTDICKAVNFCPECGRRLT